MANIEVQESYHCDVTMAAAAAESIRCDRDVIFGLVAAVAFL